LGNPILNHVLSLVHVVRLDTDKKVMDC